MEENKENEFVKYYEMRSSYHPVEKFKYSLPDIQLENISKGIRDEYLRTAILEPERLQEINDQEREALLNDLALLENTGDIIYDDLHQQPDKPIIGVGINKEREFQ